MARIDARVRKGMLSPGELGTGPSHEDSFSLNLVYRHDSYPLLGALASQVRLGQSRRWGLPEVGRGKCDKRVGGGKLSGYVLLKDVTINDFFKR